MPREEGRRGRAQADPSARLRMVKSKSASAVMSVSGTGSLFRLAAFSLLLRRRPRRRPSCCRPRPRLRCRKKPISTTKISADVSLRKTDGWTDGRGRRALQRGRRRCGFGRREERGGGTSGRTPRRRRLLKSRSLHFRCVPHFALECNAGNLYAVERRALGRCRMGHLDSVFGWEGFEHKLLWGTGKRGAC